LPAAGSTGNRLRYPEGAITTETLTPTTYDLARLAAAAADDKKASDIVLLDMRGLVAYTDYLVLATGQTPRQTKAIADEIRRRVKEETGVFPRRVEGDREADWVLMDYIDIVVHIFTPQARDFYRLDRLWHDAPSEVFVPAADATDVAPASG
jgi:ribosome-associated protein